MSKTVDCPGCGRSQPRRTPDAIYWCDACRCQFDDDPGEGGDYSNNPASRLDCEERRQQRKVQKRLRR